MHRSRLHPAFIALLLSAGASDAFGQAPGSTPQGDFLRGEGIYLQGLGSWEMNNAKAMQLNAETMKKLADWNQQYYDGLKREWGDRLARQNANQQKRAVAERQRQERLRTNPTSDDVTMGDALNALLIDLANPAIQESSWRGAKVPLPADLSLRSLAFRFAEKANAEGSQSLNGKVIALGRLDMTGHWPGYLPEDMIGPERKAYEAAYKKLSDACEKGQPIIGLALALDKEIDRLKSRAAVVIPADKGYRTAAVQHVAGLIDAAKAFQAETMDFASDYIADSHRHKAETVSDLLSFMRKYRLYFAPADKNPDTVAAYDTLYRLLRQQAETLDLKPGQGLAVSGLDLQKAEYQKVTGTWRIASQNAEGKDVVMSNYLGQIRLTIDGENYSASRGSEVVEAGVRKLNITREPNEIDVFITEGKGKGKLFLGIYEWDGNNMRLCQGLPGFPRPTQFKSGTGRLLSIYVRAER